jgi:ribonuclease BN (tRNA processing enzyme)
VPAAQPITLRFLGSGGAFSRRFGTTCSLLTLADGAKWLIDCGRQAPDQMHAAGLDWHDIDGQIITHVHGDHIYGLEDFAFRRFYFAAEGGGQASILTGGPRPKFVAHSAVEVEVWEALAPSLRYLPKPGNPPEGTLSNYFEVQPPSAVDPPQANRWNHAESFAVGALELRTREVMHVPHKPATCLEIGVGDGKIAWWSGDSTVDADYLIALEPRTTLFFHDCTFVDYPGQVHGSFALLEQLPPEIRRKTVLMHHEDDIDAHVERALAAGFRVGLPGQLWDLRAGVRLEPA